MTIREDIDKALSEPKMPEEVPWHPIEWRYRDWLRWQQDRIAELETALGKWRLGREHRLHPTAAAALEAKP